MLFFPYVLKMFSNQYKVLAEAFPSPEYIASLVFVSHCFRQFRSKTGNPDKKKFPFLSFPLVKCCESCPGHLISIIIIFFWGGDAPFLHIDYIICTIENGIAKSAGQIYGIFYSSQDAFFP